MIDPAKVTAHTMRLINARSPGKHPARSTIELCLIEAYVEAAGGWRVLHDNSCEHPVRAPGPCLPCCLMAVVSAIGSAVSRRHQVFLAKEDIAERIHAGLMTAFGTSLAMRSDSNPRN